MTVGQVMEVLETIAPASWAFSFDRIGLQIGSPSDRADKVAVCLDSSIANIDAAAEMGCSLMIAHHPVIWDPLKSLSPSQPRQKAVMKLIQHGMSFIGCHTNWDCAPGGINDALAEALELTDVKPFGYGNAQEVLKAVVYVPNDEALIQKLINALDEAGAGEIGNYRRCAFYGEGTGTFLPGAGSNPTIGEPGKQEFVNEVRLEMVLPAKLEAKAAAAIRSAHPYEEPAFEFVKIQPLQTVPFARIGRLPHPMSLAELVQHADVKLDTASLAWGEERTVNTVAVVGGAADGDWVGAMNYGADVFLTGEVRQDTAVQVADAGYAILQCGHHATENPGMRALTKRLCGLGVNAHFIEPKPGLGGRPN